MDWKREHDGEDTWMESEASVHKYLTTHSEHNQAPGIVKQINHIRFLHLTELILPHNHIDCVEALTRVYMPFIQELCLRTSPIK